MVVVRDVWFGQSAMAIDR